MGAIASTIQRFFHPASIDQMLETFVPLINGTSLNVCSSLVLLVGYGANSDYRVSCPRSFSCSRFSLKVIRNPICLCSSVCGSPSILTCMMSACFNFWLSLRRCMWNPRSVTPKRLTRYLMMQGQRMKADRIGPRTILIALAFGLEFSRTSAYSPITTGISSCASAWRLWVGVSLNLIQFTFR